MRFLFIFFTFLSIPILAQEVFTDFMRFYPTDSSAVIMDQSLISLNANYTLNSTAATNAFAKKFLFKEYITNSDKDKIDKRLKNVNRYGLQLRGEIMGNYNLDSSTSIIAGVAERYLNSAVFSKDLFDLFFRGNSMFAGKTANIHPAHYLSMDYQSIFGGLKKTMSKKLTLWGGISAIRGGNFRDILFKRGTLYTEQNGAYLQADANFNVAFSQHKPGLFAQSTGTGASLFFGANYRTGKSAFGISVSDLGFIRWNNQNTYSGNGVFTFKGKEINNVLSFSDTLLTSYNADSLAQEVGITRKIKKKSYFIPTFFKLNYVYYYSRQLFLVSGFEYNLNAGAFPRIYIQPVWQPGKNLFLHATISAGGYGFADFEFGIAGNMGRGFCGYLNIFAAEMLIAPNKTSGNGLGFSVIKRF